MLSNIRLSKKIIKIQEKLYKNSNFAVTIDGKLTEWFIVLAGVSQGCLISPNSFNIFLEFVINETQIIPHNFDMGDEDFSSIKYVDDSTLLALDFEKLQVATYELQQGCVNWGMKTKKFTHHLLITF